MRKLSLDLERLSVQSFTTETPSARAGTVRAAGQSAEYWTCNACGTGGDDSCHCGIGGNITNGWTCGVECVTGGGYTCECSAWETICGWTEGDVTCNPFTRPGDESLKMVDGCGSGEC